MEAYYKPWYYTVSHVGIGLLASRIPLVGILAIVYQLGQLLFDVRVFPVEGVIKSGNSVDHTVKKLSEIGVGYAIGTITKKWKAGLRP
jgi:hypothetical protein